MIKLLSTEPVTQFNGDRFRDKRKGAALADTKKAVEPFAQNSIRFDAVEENLCFPHWPGAGGFLGKNSQRTSAFKASFFWGQVLESERIKRKLWLPSRETKWLTIQEKLYYDKLQREIKPNKILEYFKRPMGGQKRSQMDEVENGDRAVQSYFQKIHSLYQESVEKENIARVHQRIRSQIEPHLRGKVLDIGSAGVTEYWNEQVQALFSLDKVFEFLQNSKNKSALNINGDILALPFKANCFDCIIIQHVVHHLTGIHYQKNLFNVQKAISESARVLRPGGEIFIVDSTVPPLLERLEQLHYSVTYNLLKIMRKPMIFFFSRQKLKAILDRNNLGLEKVITIDWGKMKEASQALFPWLRFPLKYTPVRCTLISAFKL